MIREVTYLHYILTMSSTNQIKIDGAFFTKLTHDNYAEWVVNIRAILRRNKLWSYTQEELAKDKDAAKWEEAGRWPDAGSEDSKTSM